MILESAMRQVFGKVFDIKANCGVVAARLVACFALVLSALPVFSALPETLTQEDIDNAIDAGVNEFYLSDEVEITESINISVVSFPLAFYGGSIVSKVDGVTFEINSNVTFSGVSFNGSSRSGDYDFFKISDGGNANFENCEFIGCGTENNYAVNVTAGLANFNGCKFRGSTGHDVRVGVPYEAEKTGVTVKGDNAMTFKICKDKASNTPCAIYVTEPLTNTQPMKIFYDFYDIPSPCPGTKAMNVVKGSIEMKKYVNLNYFSCGNNDFTFVPYNEKYDPSLFGVALMPVNKFDETTCYTIRRKIDGESIIMGLPSEDPIKVGNGIGGAYLEKGEYCWLIKSVCGYPLYYEGVNYLVNEDLLTEYEIWPYGDDYTISWFCGDYLMKGNYENGTLDRGEDFSDGAVWEIVPLPAGAVIDVPYDEDVDMFEKCGANRTWLPTYESDYTAGKVELSDQMGFACGHDVVAENVTFQRELKEGWQGICAPIALDKGDWEGFGSLWTLAEAIESQADGQAELQLRFEEVEAFEANRPYLIKVTNPGTLSVTKSNCNVSPSAGVANASVETDNVKCELSCVYDITTLVREDDSNPTHTYALSGGKFVRANVNGSKLKPYRVMLTVTANGSQPARISVSAGDKGTDNLESIEIAPAAEQWYDLNGRPASTETRGVVISSVGNKAVR